MLRGLLLSVLLAGCVTTPPAPQVSFDEVTSSATQGNLAGLDSSFARFLESARKTRLSALVGAPMPVAQVQAWTVLLDDAERFVEQKADAQWPREAMRARLQLETEFQADARTFGDVPLAVAERVPLTLRALSQRITALTARTRQVDPRHFRWPVSPLIVSSSYGSRIHPIAGEARFHAGIDLEAPLFQPVRAAEAGTVVFSAWNGAHGKQIEVQHDAHWATRYSHFEVLLARPGTAVKKGQIIGLSGQTGLTTGPHVHFELRRDGDALDPEVFLGLPATGPALISERP